MKTFLDYFSLFVADHLLRYFVPKLTQEIKINKTIFLNITFHAALKAMSKKYLRIFHVLYIYWKPLFSSLHTTVSLIRPLYFNLLFSRTVV